jgi:cell division control protein 6
VNRISKTVGELAANKTIYRNEFALTPEYTPARVPHREDAVKGIAKQIFRATMGNELTVVSVRGPAGVGKSLVTNVAGRLMAQILRDERVNFGVIQVNCQKTRTLNGILSEVAHTLSPYTETKGFSTTEIMNFVSSRVAETKTALFVILDNFSYISDAAVSSFLGFLAKENRVSKSCIALVAQDGDAALKLPGALKNRLEANALRLERYTKEQSLSILTQRVEDAFVQGAVEAEAITELADQSEGDIRFALEALRRSAKLADQQGLKRIEAGTVQTVLEGMTDSKLVEALPFLEDHELLFLYSVYSVLKERENTIIGQAETEYRQNCERLGIAPRRHTQVWSYLRNLEKIGLLSATMSGKGQRGRTTCISVPKARLSASASEIGREMKRRRIGSR